MAFLHYLFTAIFVTVEFSDVENCIEKISKRYKIRGSLGKAKARHKRLKIINLTFKWLINLSLFMLARKSKTT